MKTLSIKESVSFGWEAFKKRPWFLVSVVLIIMVLSAVVTPGEGTEQFTASLALMALLTLVVHLFIEMGLISFALKAEEHIESAEYKHLWKPEPFWRYLGVKILQTLIVITGLILLVVPGIIAGLMLMFATYITVDKGLGPIESLKESARLTKGHRWHLFGLVLALIGLNILGAIAFIVGLFVSIPVSLLAIAHTYRTLERSHVA